MMTQWISMPHILLQLAGTLLTLFVDAGSFLRLCLHPSPALAAENLFLRKQLALYQECRITSHGGLRMPHASPWSGLATGSIGAKLCASCNPQP